MEDLFKKIEQIRDLIKAILPKSTGQSVPSLPKIAPPAQPSMTSTPTPTKLPGIGPDSKKDPKKIAEQIKSGAIRKPTAPMIKFDSNGQWKLD